MPRMPATPSTAGPATAATNRTRLTGTRFGPHRHGPADVGVGRRSRTRRPRPPASARARASRAPGDWAGAATATANLRRHCSPRPTGHTPAPDRYRSPVPVTAGRTGAVSDPVPLTGVAPVDRYTADAANAGPTTLALPRVPGAVSGC